MVKGPLDPDWRDHLDDARRNLRHWWKRLRRGLRNSAPAVAVRRNDRRVAIRAAAAELRLLKQAEQPSTVSGVTVVACMRDEEARLPDFLHHYRRLGAAGFILIDNYSRDGSRDVAMAAPDVQLLAAEGAYSERLFGMDWVMAAIGQAGLGRWYLVADIDELFVYDDCERRRLPELVRLLERCGQKSMPVMMLDMYGPLSVARTRFMSGASMLDTCPFHDVDYEIDVDAARQWDARRRVIHYRGGPRARMFSTPDRPFQGILAKTPLIFWDRRTLYLDPHMAYPFNYNLEPLRGALLHFKFFSDFHDRAVAAIEHGQHWKGSSEYRHYLRVIESNPHLTLFDSRSRRYRSSASLVEVGLMPPLPWADAPVVPAGERHPVPSA